MQLPSNPAILLSYVNTKLRNNYRSLDELCRKLHADRTQIESNLSDIGYYYDNIQNRFIFKKL